MLNISVFKNIYFIATYSSSRLPNQRKRRRYIYIYMSSKISFMSVKSYRHQLNLYKCSRQWLLWCIDDDKWSSLSFIWNRPNSLFHLSTPLSIYISAIKWKWLDVQLREYFNKPGLESKLTKGGSTHRSSYIKVRLW